MLIHTCASESICQAVESGWNSLELKFLCLGIAMSCEPWIRDAQRLPDWGPTPKRGVMIFGSVLPALQFCPDVSDGHRYLTAKPVGG